VALKILRGNDMIQQAGFKELAILKQITAADPEVRWIMINNNNKNI
jgi:hypothetical protein